MRRNFLPHSVHTNLPISSWITEWFLSWCFVLNLYKLESKLANDITIKINFYSEKHITLYYMYHICVVFHLNGLKPCVPSNSLNVLLHKMEEIIQSLYECRRLYTMEILIHRQSIVPFAWNFLPHWSQMKLNFFMCSKRWLLTPYLVLNCLLHISQINSSSGSARYFFACCFAQCE